MQYGLKLAWIVLWSVPLLLGWHLWAQVCLSLKEEWVQDRRQLFCGRLAALQKNLEAGQTLWLAERPGDESKLAAAEAAALQLWQELEQADATDCEAASALAFELYQQKNESLADGYPNWWVHWSARP